MTKPVPVLEREREPACVYKMICHVLTYNPSKLVIVLTQINPPKMSGTRIFMVSCLSSAPLTIVNSTALTKSSF